MEKILQKRITFFTKIYYILFSLSLLVLIYKIDSEESRLDMNYILECKKYKNISLAEIETNGTIEDNIYTWLRLSDSLVWNKNKKVREAVVNVLVKEYGATSNEISIVKGFGNGEDLPATNKHNFNLIGIDTSYKKELIEFHKQESEYSTVEECLLKIKLLSKPFFSEVLVSLDIDNLRHSIDSLFIKPFNGYKDEY
ncbi:MAG: hypothetical protein EHM93_15965 [Bacteroidales bacterium]|nr:MAG: hypothetical protein EHM93_15965 [Bacteroidales bacterium]